MNSSQSTSVLGFPICMGADPVSHGQRSMRLIGLVRRDDEPQEEHWRCPECGLRFVCHVDHRAIPESLR